MVTLKAREGHDAHVRRDGMEKLARAVRDLGDAVAETGVDRATVDEVIGALQLLTHRLRTEIEDDAYSGLVLKPVDYSVPQGPMPLNPAIGDCSPVRPDVEMHYADGEIVGTVKLTRRFVGPPGFAHGGISAMLADQLVSCAPGAIGERTITKSLQLDYLRPLPLDEDVELWGVCEPDGDDFRARFTISARGKVAVQGTAHIVSYKRLARRDR